ncbi:sensor histidine kinase [Geodermatophilus sp. DSM 45219]|uniref:sensor histidine kinase n=1 Tax=Geodermatophilus sp. DSM 45219 TaxID=1881103 RepID=UPI000A638D29|nr:histidine kinase [Geodermatophilus sp. DSM 45219]
MPTVARWWSSRTDPQRIDLYTRSSYYSTLVFVPVLLFFSVAPDWVTASAWQPLVLLGSSVVTTAACLVLTRRGFRDRAAGPDRQALLVALVSGLVTVGAALAVTGEAPSPAGPWVAGVLGAAVLLALSVTVPTRPLIAGAAVAGVLAGGVALVDGNPPFAAVVIATSIGVAVGFFVSAFRFSVWILDVVLEMERTRGVQAQLAVAEERLRFARDLHDVMGRNLSAIAVKSQLAAELVRRGRDGAADELADISRVAEESLREVRDVVRGYRRTDLPGELAGARSVLRAAGVAVTVTGEEQAVALPEPVQTALGWVVREAVTNVLRHSRASWCSVELLSVGGEAELQVANDGAGGTAGSWGNGLTGLAERLAATGGRLSAGPDGDRFVLAATVPVGVPA